MKDHEFVHSLMLRGKKCDNECIDEFVLSSPAPVFVTAKLSNIYAELSKDATGREKDDYLRCSKYCEDMTAELLTLFSTAESPQKILESIETNGVAFVDFLIEHELKEVIATPCVQSHLGQVWMGGLKWTQCKKAFLLLVFVLIPPVWVFVSGPLGNRYYKIPLIQYMSAVTSHIYLILLFCLTSVTPIASVLPIRENLFPTWYEWMLFVWLTELLISELSNPNPSPVKGVKLSILGFGILAVGLQFIGLFLDPFYYGTLLYARNQLIGMAVFLACLQTLDFLSFHPFLGPWTVMAGHVKMEMTRFLAVLVIYLVGFSLWMCTLNSPIHSRISPGPDDRPRQTLTNGLPSGILVTPIDAFELLFFALFGLNGAGDLKIETLGQPEWTLVLFKCFFALFMCVCGLLLTNLLIAMVVTNYARPQGHPDTEWKYRMAQRIMLLHRRMDTPSPINLIFNDWTSGWIYKKFGRPQAHGLGNQQGIETVTDWALVVKRYRTLVGKEHQN